MKYLITVFIAALAVSCQKDELTQISPEPVAVKIQQELPTDCPPHLYFEHKYLGHTFQYNDGLLCREIQFWTYTEYLVECDVMTPLVIQHYETYINYAPCAPEQ
jgi:hypothetical protein